MSQTDSSQTALLGQLVAVLFMAAEGADRGAPASPDILKKAAITTVVSAVLFGIVALFAKLTE